MLRRKFQHDVDDMPDAKFRAWVSVTVASLFDLFVVVIIALIAGAIVLFANATDKAQRIKVVDGKLENLACLALHYIPPGTGFYHDLKKQYPHCPPYVGDGKIPPSRISHPSSKPVGSGPGAVRNPASATPHAASPTPGAAIRSAAARTSAKPTPKSTVRVRVPGPTQTKTVTSRPPTQKATTLPVVPCISVAVVRVNCG